MDPLKSVRSLDPAKRAFTLFDEFKAFALKGNVIDLAVGVIIGAAFGKIVDSLVKHIIMPLVSVVLPGKQGYLDWKWVRDLHASQFERPARSGNRDPVFRDAQLPRLVDTVGRHHEDAGSLLGQVARCLAIEVVTVPMRDKGHVEERRQLLGPWHVPRR
jgi:hypothetical protein